MEKMKLAELSDDEVFQLLQKVFALSEKDKKAKELVLLATLELGRRNLEKAQRLLAVSVPDRILITVAKILENPSFTHTVIQRLLRKNTETLRRTVGNLNTKRE